KPGVAYVEGSVYLDLLAAWDAENRGLGSGESGVGSRAPHPPAPDSRLPTPDSRLPYLLNLEQACELGLINSREFQDRREALSLAALPVTLERFAFAAQWFATEQAIREASGRDTPDGHTNRWISNGNVGFSKLFSTGALLLVRIANQTVINLSGTGS